MTPGFNRNNGSISAITLGLVAILLLIRINPIYYAAQFIAARHADAHSTPVIRRAENNQAILRCQRGISEQIQTISLPEIKFTGTLFNTFFTALVNEGTNSKVFSTFGGVILSNAQRVAVLRNLRL